MRKETLKRFNELLKRMPIGYVLTETGAPRGHGECRMYALKAHGRLLVESSRLSVIERYMYGLLTNVEETETCYEACLRVSKMDELPIDAVPFCANCPLCSSIEIKPREFNPWGMYGK